ncbi:uncharacterized protein LOC119732922 [Patiria miniata]|uniref:Integrase core domain-containing protein n=1 Tax=Patiria miniata TaxID=46514 RepID=A0A914AFD0_PATMI|nr:uncharacterized protein LOC119732922 [Patiria miniata]
MREGVWTQLRVDQGTEFVLTTFIQDCLAEYRPEQNCAPWVATSSVHNLRIERIWPEVNQRVNYPLKRVVVAMHEQGLIHMQDDVEKFCVSMVLIKVARIGVQRFMSSWNNHHMRASIGRPGATGTPEQCFQQNNRVASLMHVHVPTTEELVHLYQQRGGRIESSGRFGWDPIGDDMQLVHERQRRLELNFPSYEECFNSAVRGDNQPLQQTIIGCIRITFNIVNTL